MDVRKTLQPGEKGTKRWHRKYGENLIKVRYRYDDIKRLRYTTVELIVEQKPYIHCNQQGLIKAPQQTGKQLKTDQIINIKIGYNERKERQAVKAVGGIWNAQKKLWSLPYSKVKELGMEKRIIKDD